MHNNYYFLRKLTPELESEIKGAALMESFSQHKDELILRFLKSGGTDFFIRAHLDATFCCLSFPGEFNRARKNSINLFQDADGSRVVHIHQFENERSFSIKFGDGNELLFKMHGNRSNIIFLENGFPKLLFRNHLKADLEIDISRLDKNLDFGRETFLKHTERPENYYVTLGPLARRWFEDHDWDEKSADEKWFLFTEFQALLMGQEYHVCSVDGKIILSLFEIGDVRSTHTSPIEALNEFYRTSSVTSALDHERHAILKLLNSEIRHSQNYITKNKLKLAQLTHDNHYQKWADLIMANMHRITTGMESIDVVDLFEQSQVIHIPLNPQLSPQENAERYYRKGKNQKVEIQKLSDSLHQKAEAMSRALALRSKTEEAEHLKDLRALMSSVQKTAKQKTQVQALPYHEFDFMNFKIWVGKNAEQNDRLTLKYTFKEDLWLHAKDVAGSHVVIKHQSGKQFPKQVIHRAAELAAFNSRRKTETLCAVIYTPKKYVRKRKGDPPGAVVVEKEKVILVEPRK